MQWWEGSLAQLGAVGLLLFAGGLVIRALWKEKLAADERERAKAVQDAEVQKAWIAAVNSFAGELAKLQASVQSLADAARGRN